MSVEAGRRLVVRYRVTGPSAGPRVWIRATGVTGMARRKQGKPRHGAGATPNGGATIGHEAALWSMDAAEYKHVVLGLIFPKCISDAFEERREVVLAEWGRMPQRTGTSREPFSGSEP